MRFVYCVMEAIIGGDQPKTLLEKIGVEKVVDWSKVNLPKYNPHQFELARNLDGLTRSQYAKVAGLSIKRYTSIEKGDIAPTEEDVCLILTAQGHVLKGFYEQWPETEIDCSGYFGKPVAIDYYKYKVFRDMNKPRMKVLK
jgi:DNA-binding XRE family transcriptional regulator